MQTLHGSNSSVRSIVRDPTAERKNVSFTEAEGLAQVQGQGGAVSCSSPHKPGLGQPLTTGTVYYFPFLNGVFGFHAGLLVKVPCG